MALTPELTNALSTSTTWREYQSKLLKEGLRIEIPFWKLDIGDLSDFKFFKCDFQTIIFKNTNLDNCTFCDCTFLNCIFENVSFVDAKLIDCRMKTSDIKSIVIRNTDISKCQFENSTFTDIELKDSIMQETNINGGIVNLLRGTNISLFSTTFNTIKFNNINNESYTIRNLKISKCSFANLSLSRTELVDCLFEDILVLKGNLFTSNANTCKIIRPDIKEFSFSDCNFFSGQFIDVDLNEFQINKIGLLGSSLINCKWPKQEYSINFIGKYIPAINLLRQPVEDVQGLTPNLRAEIRRAQLVEEMVKTNKSPLKKFVIWFWAVTSEYGRSISRLTTLCITVIFILSILFWLFSIPCIYWQTPKLWIIDWYPLVKNLFISIKYIALNFIGIENLSETKNYQQEVISIITRVVGLIFFGLWIGIAVNKFGSPS